MAAVLTVIGTVHADESPPPRAFEPGELSIGEPIALPFGRPAEGTTAAAAAPSPTDDPRADLQPPTAGLAVPGSGWLGLAVSESAVPGRWQVEEVAPRGPAARAGIAVGDELRAVNGVNMASAADVTQALTGIAAGQDVRVAVARAEQVTDLVLRAEPRPVARPAEPPRFVAAPADTPAPPAAAPPARPAPVPAAAAPAVTQTSAPEWQAATAHDPQPVPSQRFGPRLATDPTASPPSVVAAPAAVAVPSAMAASTPPARGSGRTALGVRTVPIDTATQARFQLPQPAGAYVVGVVQNLPADKAGVPPGSVIVALGEQPVRSPEELTKLVASGPLDRPVTVQFVLPGGAAKQAAVVLQALDDPLERALTGAGTAAVPPPTLQPAPRRAERPTVDESAIRTEVRALRGMLDRLERLLDPASRRRP